ncbi:MAG: hypothetical protein OEU36_22285 [Gammaproteobacteria bacterium]|nr:hypothetical protein [Gammaproteobacteria bacterium]
MNQSVFVPLTDELLYEHPELIAGPIVPYDPRWARHRWLEVEINPVDDDNSNYSTVEFAA